MAQKGIIMHRDCSLRDQIINAYLERKKMKLGDLVRSVKSAYPVTIQPQTN